MAAALIAAGSAAAQTISTHPFSVEQVIVNQCTGEPITVSLAGRVVARQARAGAAYRHTIVSEIQGSAADANGTRYRFVGNERAEFETATAEAELTLFNNVRVLTRGGEAALLGHDTQTISIDAAGEIRGVSHRFDLTCD